MNSMQENNQMPVQTSNRAIADLRKRNTATIQKLQDTPYAPTVYAVPKEHWESFLTLLQNMEQYYEATWDQLEKMSTKKELQEQEKCMMEEMIRRYDMVWDRINKWSKNMDQQVIEEARRIVPEVQDLLQDTRRLLSQDGKMREEFMKRTEELDKQRVNYLEEFGDWMTTKMRWYFIGTILASLIAASIATFVTYLRMM